jgi:hypothetical protein
MNFWADWRIFHCGCGQRGNGSFEKGRPTYWNKAPAADDGSKQLTTADVDVLGAE